MAVWWIRRDLRLHDNPALAAAAGHGVVLPVFVLDPHLSASLRTPRGKFLLNSLRKLDERLRGQGSRLLVRSGDPAEVIPALARQTGAVAVYAQEDYSAYARARDRRVAERAPLVLLPGVTVHPPGSVANREGRPYQVFSRYRETWLRLPRARPWAGASSFSTPEAPSEPLPQVPCPADFPPGEEEALVRLRAFVEGAEAPVYRYAEGRNRLDFPSTSRLSPYLRFGVISARVVVAAAHAAARQAPGPQARRGAELWRDQLIWREYFVTLLASEPDLRTTPLRARFADFAWREDEADFRAWEEGRTGFPVVDAAMRQLRETGWMHNRARLVAASFLSRLLLVDWRRGEQVFFDLLVDGDPALNAGNWQWTAGVGTDTAPYIRLFNPVRQGQRFDPHGDYVKRWIPELRRVPAPYVHAPWTLPRDDQIAYRCRVGRDYPAPLVDLGSARERAVRAFGGGLHKPLRPPTGRVRS
mgnify:CR=1 FL=1